MSVEIKNIIRDGDKSNLEIKETTNGLPRSVFETYSAFANTKGGTILLGIKEEINDKKNLQYEIKGVKNVEKVISDFWNTINSEKVNANILTEDNVQVNKINKKSVILITVPEADFSLKPVFINGNPYKGTYKRNYEGDYHAKLSEINAMIRDSQDLGDDGQLLKGYDLDDIDKQTLKSYRQEFENINPDHLWNQLDDVEFLRNLGAYAKDRDTGDSYLTQAGLLMFGKGLSVREKFDNIRMDYIDKTDLEEGVRWKDRITYDGTWENNLYNFVRTVIPKLTFGLKRPFKLEGVIRTDDTLTKKAVREAVINMIIHTDYKLNGILKIEKHDHFFSFSNPGSLKLPNKTIYEGGTSKSRNPRVQTMLRLIGFGENIGSGFPTILEACNRENWRFPDLSYNESLNQVELELWTIPLEVQESNDDLRILFGPDFKKLSETEKRILSIIYTENSSSFIRLKTLTNLEDKELKEILTKLISNDFLIYEKDKYKPLYLLNKNYELSENSFDEKKELNENEKIILGFLKIHKVITASEVIKITNLTSTAGAYKLLNRLIDKGFALRKRNGRTFDYFLEKDNYLF